MIAFSRSRLLTLVFSALAPVVVVIACAGQPADPDGNGDGGECAASQTECNGNCVDLQTNQLNCGSCGRACTMVQPCIGGQCSCAAPFTACPPGGTSCILTTTDVNNCGACGNVCPASAPFCMNGTCSATCNLMTCGTACTSTATDPTNCGTCGNRCALGQTCNGGTCACPAGTMLCNGQCATSCGSGGTGGGGAGGTAGTAGAATGGAGGAGAGGAAGSGTSGSGGMAPVMKDCATKVVPAAPLLTDFESYDGTVPLHTETGSWTFTIGPATAPAYAGLYTLNDMTGTYTLIMGGGANASMRAPRGSNTLATSWGGGVGLWMGCIDARAYAGLSFWARGVSPNGMLSVGLSMEDTSAPSATDPAGGGTCTPAGAMGCAGPSAAIAITADWTQYTVPWAMFMPGRGASDVAVMANGDEITGISFGAQMNYVPNPADDGGTYIPEPGMYEVAIDDLGFM